MDQEHNISDAFLIREAIKGLNLELDTYSKQLAVTTDRTTLKYQAENLLYFSLTRVSICLPGEVKAKVDAVLELYNAMRSKAIGISEGLAEQEPETEAEQFSLFPPRTVRRPNPRKNIEDVLRTIEESTQSEQEREQ